MKAELSMIRPKEGVQNLFQALPVLKITLTIRHDQRLYVNAGKPTSRIGDEFLYEKPYMPSEKITVRWWPTERSEDLKPATLVLPIRPPSGSALNLG